MRVRFVAGLLLVSICLAAITTRGAVINEFNSQEQQILTVTGRIVSTRNIGGVCYLYFGRDLKRSLVAVILAAHRSQFPDRPEHSFRNQHVQVSGLVRENQGRMEIVLKDSDQIAIIDPGKSASPVASDHRSLRLEAKMTRLEAELRDLKKQVARSERYGAAGSNAM